MFGQTDSVERGSQLLRSLGSRGRGLRLFAQRFARNRGAVVGLIFVCLVMLIASFADVLAPYDPWALGTEPFLSPTSAHMMGTDDLGRDVLSGVLYGGRASLTVGLAAAGMALVMGVSVGAISGYFGGIVGDALMRVTEMFMVIPRFFLAILIVAFFGSGLEKVIFVIGILSWPTVARLVRAQFLWLREQEFVEAARSLGMGRTGLIVSEILPNALPPAIVAGSLEIARAILLEALVPGRTWQGILPLDQGRVEMPEGSFILSDIEHDLGEGITLTHGIVDGTYLLRVEGAAEPTESIFDRIFDGRNHDCTWKLFDRSAHHHIVGAGEALAENRIGLPAEDDGLALDEPQELVVLLRHVPRETVPFTDEAVAGHGGDDDHLPPYRPTALSPYA